MKSYGQRQASSAETIGGAVEACRRMLLGISDTPWLDARVLAGHVTGLDASAIVAYGDHRLDAKRRERLLALAQRRAAGEPVAYLVGHKEFCGLRLLVDRRVLVPRPETEELVLAIAHDWRGNCADIIDIGTGSGAIACALADMLPRAQITATDVSAGALEVAKANVEQLGLSERVALLEGDLFTPLAPGRSFDVIVANLPYVADTDAALAPDVRAYEPGKALFAGADGLDAYRLLLDRAPERLKPLGRAYFECGPFNARALRDIAQAAFPDREVMIRADAGGCERMVLVA
jgi:release factor glutamine methyltransferase